MPRASCTVAGARIFSPGMCAYQPSRLCECCAASWRPPPVAIRITIGTANCPPDMCGIVAALFTIWSRASSEKLTVMISTIRRIPPRAAPIPAPTKESSDSGVSRIRSGPNSASSPRVTAYVPPYSPMSSPIRNTRSSRSSASRNASRTASR